MTTPIAHHTSSTLLLHHLATPSAHPVHQEPLPGARKPQFAVKLREPEVDNDTAASCCFTSHSPLPTHLFPLFPSLTRSFCAVFRAQERRQSLAGVAAHPRRRSRAPTMLQTSPGQAVPAIDFHDSPAPSYTHSSIPANPTVRFRPYSVTYAAALPVYGRRRNPRS